MSGGIDRAVTQMADALGDCGLDAAVALAAALADLPAERRVILAGAALAALDDDLLMDVVDTLTASAGWPLPPFLRLAEEARLWAADASTAERKFYAWAAVERLAPRDRASLIRALQSLPGGREIAA